jgi:ThiJ/PfpI family-like
MRVAIDGGCAWAGLRRMRDDGRVRVLIPLPDRDFDVTEVAVPWRVLRATGHQVVFATEQAGTVPAADPRLLTRVLFGQLGAAPEAKRFYAELVQAGEFTSTQAREAVNPAAFDGLLLPGGHAPGMRQYLGSAVLRDQVARFWGARPARRRDLPRRPGAGANPRTRGRPQPAGQPPDYLPAQIHGTPGLREHRLAARPLLPDLPRLRRG